MSTFYHSKFLALDLTRRRSAEDAGRLTGAVAGARVDLNPHQVDAALFAVRSPLMKGALLADEVGLGKTIEAGLVIAQRWAEGRRRILVITPSNLRKQWHQELGEKFFLPCEILEARFYNAALRNGQPRPFEPNSAITICSYQFARNKAEDVARAPWDLVVIDEAHRLRNVWKPGNVLASALKAALAGRSKILLTATPLQNSLLELYGLASLIDEHVFGDVGSFRERYMGQAAGRGLPDLRDRLQSICHRTLRRQVQAYVPYTKRHALVEEFTPGPDEQRLYELVSDYLQRPQLEALPAQQRALTTMVLRKLLASSSFAIAGALETMARRLRAGLSTSPQDDIDDFDETEEEWGEEADEARKRDDRAAAVEADELERMAALATSIARNAKGKALLRALGVAFAKAEALGAARKAIIFTESRRTQDYLLNLLAGTPWGAGIVLFNGSNTDDRSRAIYEDWIERHRGSDRVTGSRTADMRQALVDHFRERGTLMIATEAGAEGINLQFCSLVVNFDLPWNPQRIEQRIGRCHRYGQKHDVVVVNFLNRGNEADRRVYELLHEKFALFEGVFGASDEVLGAIGSGVDFERRVADIYQRCRAPEEIRAAFDALQAELAGEIDASMAATRTKLLENFDDEVRERLRETAADAAAALDRFERDLWRLTRVELGEAADWVSPTAFRLAAAPDWAPEAAPGLYEGPRGSGEGHVYRPGHPLAKAAIERATARELPVAEVAFDLSGHAGKISALEPFRGRAGWLRVEALAVEAGGEGQDWLLQAAATDDGALLPGEALARLWTLEGTVGDAVTAPEALLDGAVEAEARGALDGAARRRAALLAEEERKLDAWAEDLKTGLERELKEIDREIGEARRAAAAALTLEQKLDAQKAVRALEQRRNVRRRTLFEAQDEIDTRRGELIAGIEAQLAARINRQAIMVLRWRIL
jgi:adenine-specific DNA-methyltransferase